VRINPSVSQLRHVRVNGAPLRVNEEEEEEEGRSWLS
jgi:hypothetical protein